MSTMNRREQMDHKIHKDVQRMSTAEGWPRWPWLPMIKYDHEKMDSICGVFHADDTDPNRKPRIYITNLFEVKTYFPIKDWKYVEFESIEAICKDGWRVD